MLTAVVCAVLCGHREWTGIVEWLHDQSVDIWHAIGFTRRPPLQGILPTDLSRNVPAKGPGVALRRNIET
jgi:hypothetical protein